MKETYIRRQTVAIVRRQGPSDWFGVIIYLFGKFERIESNHGNIYCDELSSNDRDTHL